MLQHRVKQQRAAKEVAALVADIGKSDWLAEFFDLSIDQVRFARVVDDMLPGRKKLQSRLASAAAAAQSIFHELHSPAIHDLLPPPGADCVSDQSLARALLGLVRRFREAAEGSDMSNVDGALKLGRGRARAAMRVAPELVCAAVAMEVLQRLRGKPTPVGSRKAAAVAQRLWEAAGGDAHDIGEEPLARWKPRFRRLGRTDDPRRTEALEKLREEIREALLECEKNPGVVARRARVDR